MAPGDAVQFESARCQQRLEITEADVRVTARVQATEKFAWTHSPTLRPTPPGARGILRGLWTSLTPMQLPAGGAAHPTDAA